MASSPDSDAFELGDYLGVLRRRWWLILAAASLGTLLAAGYVALAPKTYTATASVYVSSNAANAVQAAGGRTAGVAVNMDNEAQIAQSNTVAGPAAKAMHSRLTVPELIRRVSVTVPANTTVLEISCDASSSRGAAICAQAFATSYLATREAAAKGLIAFQVSQLQDREAPLQARALKLMGQLRALPPRSPRQFSLHAQVRNIDSQLAKLRGNISSLGGSVNYNPGSIITPAVPPSRPSSPKPLLALPSGLVAGLLIGLVLAFAIDRRDDRIHSAGEVGRFLGLPVLFSLHQKRLAGAASLASPRSETGRAFTELAEAVGAGLGDGNHIIAVAASSPGQAGGIVAANLAAAIARTRADVLLVCADPQNTIMQRLLHIDGRHGLVEVMAGKVTLDEAAQRVAEVARLRVLTPGGTAALLVDHLDYDVTQDLMKQLRQLARYVIIEVRATGEVADTFGFAEFADTAIVVIETSAATRTDATNCVARLDRMRTGILGSAVLPAIRLPRTATPGPIPVRSPGRAPAAAAASPAAQPAREEMSPRRTAAASPASPAAQPVPEEMSPRRTAAASPAAPGLWDRPH